MYVCVGFLVVGGGIGFVVVLFIGLELVLENMMLKVYSLVIFETYFHSPLYF